MTALDPIVPSPQAILESLLRTLEPVAVLDGGRVDIVGDDPVVESRFRPAAAAAAALAAQGAGVAEIWRIRSGQRQQVTVEARRAAVPGLRTINYVRQNGIAHELFPRSTTSFNNFFTTRDGRQIYLLRNTMYVENLLGTLELLGCRYDEESMAGAVRQWDGEALEDALAARKLVGVLSRTRSEWRSHPHGAWLDARPPVEVTRIGSAPAEPLAPASRPLSGLRVLDFSHVLAGPVTARMFAEQGADVLRVSAQHQMDPMRIAIDTGAGKRSAHLDLDNPDEVERLKDLVRSCDIFVESWRPGSLDRRGLSPQALAEIRPGIIYVSVSAYGSGGPWSDRIGYEPVGQVACGLAGEEGTADAPRLAVTGTLNDYLTAYLAAAGTMAALIRRSREGGSQHVRASLTRTSMWLQEIGELPRDIWPGAMPMEPLRGDLIDMASPFGMVTVPGPITQYEHTPGYWDRPPQPFGASLPVWLPR
ncbi:MAG TPA: CoA transferase [Sphingomonadaceae bacterium]|nr:CoA transferase [Sphingomonadaceae bacterium]